MKSLNKKGKIRDPWIKLRFTRLSGKPDWGAIIWIETSVPRRWAVGSRGISSIHILRSWAGTRMTWLLMTVFRRVLIISSPGRREIRLINLFSSRRRRRRRIKFCMRMSRINTRFRSTALSRKDTSVSYCVIFSSLNRAINRAHNRWDRLAS